MKRKEKLFLIISVTFVIPGGGNGTFYLETREHFTRSRTEPAPQKNPFCASLFNIFERQGWVSGIYRLDVQIRLEDLTKLKNNIETRALLKEDAQMRISLKKKMLNGYAPG